MGRYSSIYMIDSDGDVEKKDSTESTHLNKCVDIIHQSLSSTNDELVHTCYGVGSEWKKSTWILFKMFQFNLFPTPYRHGKLLIHRNT